MLPQNCEAMEPITAFGGMRWRIRRPSTPPCPPCMYNPLHREGLPGEGAAASALHSKLFLQPGGHDAAQAGGRFPRPCPRRCVMCSGSKLCLRIAFVCVHVLKVSSSSAGALSLHALIACAVLLHVLYASCVVM